MLCRPRCFRHSVTNNAATAEGITTECEAPLFIREIECNADQPVRQNLSGTEPTESCERSSGLEMLAISHESFKFLQSVLEASEANNSVLHCFRLSPQEGRSYRA